MLPRYPIVTIFIKIKKKINKNNLDTSGTGVF